MVTYYWFDKTTSVALHSGAKKVLESFMTNQSHCERWSHSRHIVKQSQWKVKKNFVLGNSFLTLIGTDLAQILPFFLGHHHRQLLSKENFL